MRVREKILFLLCEHSGYPLFEEVGIVPENAVVKKIPCAGRLEKDKLLEYLVNDFSKIVIVSCFEGACHYVYGNTRCAKKITALKKDLSELSLDQDIIAFHSISANMHDEFKTIINGK